MDEYRRLGYLEAMGVRSYAPRFRLPGAKPSVQCQLPVVARARAPEAEIAASTGTIHSDATRRRGGEARTADIQSLLGDTPATVRPIRQEPAAGASSTSSGPVAVRFSLRIVSSETGWLVVDGTDHSVPERQVLHFIRNLLYAVSGGMPHLKATHFRWPFTDNPGLDRSENAAREAVLASVRAHLERSEARRVLTLGDVATRYLPAEQQIDKALLVRAPDCAQLFAEPQRKAELWQSLSGIASSDT